VKSDKKRSEVLERVLEHGGLKDGVASEVADETGLPEAEIYGAASFFHLLAEPGTKVRVCTGLSCELGGSRNILDAAKAAGLPAGECSCLAACDRPPAVLRGREVLVEVDREDIEGTQGKWEDLSSEPGVDWRGAIGPTDVDGARLAMNLAGEPDYRGQARARARELGADAVLDQVETSGLQGRGGAGFPAAIKWRGVRGQNRAPHYVVLNADEGEPGTFKDRELLLRRPDLVLEGLAIAADIVGAEDIYLYLRGEFQSPWRSLEKALAGFESSGALDGIRFHLHAGHGAYICGEETALLEALEGKRGMPRLKPPYPHENGLWGQPTLIQNVETIACVPAIVLRGGQWFKELGKTEPGTKLYSVSGHVARPGNYELPLGVSLDELVEAAGGYIGELKAFSPGGASSGFLPASERTRPLDFSSLVEIGSMLGSAGVVVLNDTVDMRWAVAQQLRFFEVESCGQCAPCRIGTRFEREAVERFIHDRDHGRAGARVHLAQVEDVAWEMVEGSICGLGQTAPLPLTSAMRHFPDEFSDG
jgi:NADH:ubiquinone oxidoreductase subunit F (NADH-binding)/NADH:ubiquinone oxidoreductase subunit E